MNKAAFAVLTGLVLGGCATAFVVPPSSPSTRAVAESVLSVCRAGNCGLGMDPGARVDTVLVRPDGRIEVVLNEAFAQVPLREEGVEALYDAMEGGLGARPLLTALGQPIEELVPNLYRSHWPPDASRRPIEPTPSQPMVRFPDRGPLPTRGLAGRHIALWASHGWYYEPTTMRWEWQRARLFSTVEDILPTAFVLPYLAPMLERAGAHVWMPRERDPQPDMAVVDNDGPAGYVEHCITGAGWRGGGTGFAMGPGSFGRDQNPWTMGTYRRVEADPAGGCQATWTSRSLGPGQYAVYVSHGDSERPAAAARWFVRHAGGTTRFEVDQRMAAGTWIYVGTFAFDGPAMVGVTNAGPAGTTVTADAVRLGGGMGLIERGGVTSGRPRWLEGSRYALQFDGMPASLVYNVTDDPANDYVDDYRNRGEWVNYLRGAPLGPNKEPSHPGLGVPIDVSLAFHTDAGISPGIIGTLAIYSSRGNGADGVEARVFQDGMSRFANRDLADVVQTQLVRDLRARYTEDWTRRSIWDRDYSEAYRPNVPSMLLELLSHQNFQDMRFALDPRFRFDVSRAIYKALVRFVAGQHGEAEPVIAPLAPRFLKARAEGDSVEVSWGGTEDPLEPTAGATSFRLYTRQGASTGFDDGRVVEGTQVRVRPDSTYASFRVTAVNAGGESAFSETVGASTGGGLSGRVLVVSGFDRVGPPAAVDVAGWQGFPEYLDQGVPDGQELSFVGSQHEFSVTVPWRDDDDPGHGASHADWETRTEWGNTFDFAAQAGVDLVKAGLGTGFDTMSDESVGRDGVPSGYDLVYVLLGEERGQVQGHVDRPEFRPFPAPLRQALTEAVGKDVALLVSGSYATEELEQEADDGLRFLRTVLGARHRAVRASRAGEVEYTRDDASRGLRTSFMTGRGGPVYGAENPESVVPAADGAETLLRYTDSAMSAAVGFGRVVTVGFPLETIVDPQARRALLTAIGRYLDRPQ